MAAGQSALAGASEADRVCLHDAQTGQWLDFSRPYRVITTSKAEEVVACLREVERLVASHGWAAAGFLAYEAAPAFDAALQVRAESCFPLLRFGLYPPPRPVELPEPVDGAARSSLVSDGRSSRVPGRC